MFKLIQFISDLIVGLDWLGTALDWYTRTFHDRMFLIYLSSGLKLQRELEFLLSNCVFVPISFVYICPLRLSFFVSFFSFCRLSRQCWVPVSQCGLSEMYMLFTVDNLRIGSIDIHTNYDYSIFVFRLDEPIRQSRVRWVPYHCYISVAISLKNIGQKFYLYSENRYWRRDYFHFDISEIITYLRYHTRGNVFALRVSKVAWNLGMKILNLKQLRSWNEVSNI